MESDIEQLGQIVAAVILAGVGLFALLQALRSRLASAPTNHAHVEAAPIDQSTAA
jgi:hypothetical protein